MTKFVRSRWLDIGLICFFASLWTSASSQSVNTQKKNLANIQPSWPHTSHLFNNPCVMKRNCLFPSITAWLPPCEKARWCYLNCSGLPAVWHEKISPKAIQKLLYWPSFFSQDAWIHVTQIRFGPQTCKKRTLPISSHLDLTLGSHTFRLLPSASHLFALSMYSDFCLSIDPQTSLRSSSKNTLADSSAAELCFTTSSMLDSFNCREKQKVIIE